MQAKLRVHACTCRWQSLGGHQKSPTSFNLTAMFVAMQRCGAVTVSFFGSFSEPFLPAIVCASMAWRVI